MSCSSIKTLGVNLKELHLCDDRFANIMFQKLFLTIN